MRPAYSVILLTTLIGAGQGLFVAFFAADLAARAGWIGGLPASLHVQASLLSFAFLAAGLAASFFHLGKPLRGWRAAAMWRTSWLSREVLVLPAFSAITLVHAWAWRHSPEAAIWTGLAGILLCAALFVCTGMIYACLRFLQEWHTPLTVCNFIVLGLASGCMLAAALGAIAWPAAAIPFGGAALALTLSGLILRASILARNARLKPKSTLQSATGLKQRRLVQISQGMTGGSYGAHAFFHGRGTGTLRWVKWAFLSLGFVLPAAFSVLAWVSSRPAWFIAAFVLQYLGLVAERWFFFAQARHPQNLYYQWVS